MRLATSNQRAELEKQHDKQHDAQHGGSLKGCEVLEISRVAVAGSLESSDVQVTVTPAEEQVTLELSSSVLMQYGRRIRRVVLDTLAALGVETALVTVVDKGALDCTIRARTECAVYRAMGYWGPIPWGGEFKL